MIVWEVFQILNTTAHVLVTYWQQDKYKSSEDFMLEFQAIYLAFGNLIPLALVLMMNCIFMRI